ncbi:MAG: 30S ribosomal protein S20 [Deltaproteobacteria bacterium]|uniref:30S ribosomal protein S20 n=1 Tax=Hydrosulfovibrio ferrireducens TaxID=2934181 RepID=UPI000CB8A7A5|nr:30S ribosomal protein S20 [Pseudomonadota bacterium]MCG2822393.1 30S ribosomal protein S20 [Desulfobulbaceae bacterium]MDP2002082.1 30S ribosomal protein S20 [Desulfurivibrionaceae bacterium]PKN48875.1 MAG: 30S ribosomal protein S20 [Deltaproteobacteria bacterium HGW-Deltaproteobacteria-16]TDB37283.1 MAG: 30S ribosomal protein S20 [Deltaproteobacteria bacterium]
MANHKSAEKRNRQNQLQRLRNRSNKSKMKGVVKKVLEAIELKSGDQAQEALKAAIPVIEKTAVKGSIHKKNASRKVSRLTKRVNALLGAAQ